MIAEDICRLGSERPSLTFEAFDARFHVAEASVETGESRSHLRAYVRKTGPQFLAYFP
ncbi:MAG: hypothetical protein ACLPYS_04995 [Vulcanimicrobiaceae bacterium]